MLNIALVGYGKMGRAIEQEALNRGHRISLIVDKDNLDDLQSIHPDNTDVAIEFTHPNSFERNLELILSRNLPLVSGTTGWYEKKAAVQDRVEALNGAFVYSSNFSIGVQLLFKLNRQLAEWMNRYDVYDCFIEERHHRHKADAPSGTAIQLAEGILELLDRKTLIAGAEIRERAPKPEELSIGFVRSGEVVGYHSVSYTSDIDTIKIEHHANNRRGFAVGAVVAAERLVGKKGFFEFSTFI